MGRLDFVTDPTGKMNDVELNATNIQQIIDELNRNSDQLDTLQKGLSITNPGRVTLNVANGPSSQNVSVPIGSASPFSFLAFVQRSDLPNNYYALPYILVSSPGSSATNQIVAYASLNQPFGSNQVQLTFDVEVAPGVTAPPTMTFFYYILNQPANPGG